LEEVQSQLKPASIPDKKVVLANHSTRSGGQADVPSLEKVSDKKRRTAKLRAKVIHAWDESGWDVYRFVAEYNAGNIAPDLRGALGGKPIGKSTLYNWTEKYQNNDEAGLVPQYKKKGGSGASLDKHTKDLIWFYSLWGLIPCRSAAVKLW
jgi:hypothetical protein